MKNHLATSYWLLAVGCWLLAVGCFITICAASDGGGMEIIMSIVLLLCLFSAIILFEVPRLIGRKRRRELIVFSALLGLGLGLSLAQLLDLPLPSLLKIFSAILHIKF